MNIAKSYQRLLDLAAEARATEGIRQGLNDLHNGRMRAAEDVFDELRAERGIPTSIKPPSRFMTF